jgi:DNA-binding HxlR family transcriptional regulator
MPKFQIFVSSTYEDLKLERDQVIKAILEMGHIPVGMEMFSAADDQQWDIIKKQIDESDYYVVLVAHRYGSMEGETSYTEKEYDYAISKKVPVLGFVLDSSVDWPNEWIENNRDIRKRLELFRTKVSSKMVSFWKSPDDLYGRAGIALMKSFASNPREGWVRASEANTSEMTAEITRLSRENGQLRARIEADIRTTVDAHEQKINELIDGLRRNVRYIYVWRKASAGWGEPISTNLCTVFEVFAQDLIDEGTNNTLMASLAFHHVGQDYRMHYPIPSNYLKAFIADLAALDLLASSKKRHSVQDTHTYWSLTELGREVHSRIRKNEILKGLVSFDEDPEDEDTEYPF